MELIGGHGDGLPVVSVLLEIGNGRSEGIVFGREILVEVATEEVS